MKDPRAGDLLAYCKRVEMDFFEHANSVEEYYGLLAEKIYKICEELVEKKELKLATVSALQRQQNDGRLRAEQNKLNRTR